MVKQWPKIINQPTNINIYKMRAAPYQVTKNLTKVEAEVDLDPDTIKKII